MLCVALSEDAACCLDFSRRFLKEQLQSNLPDEVSHARVRVPVFFNAAQPQPILDAVTVPGLHVVTVPAAAGMVSAMALPNLEKNSPVCGFRPGTSEVSLHDPLLIGVFEKARLANAVWDAIALTFRGDTIRAKVYEAVDNTRQTQQEKNRERNLRWGNPRQGTEPLYIASSAATGACTRLEDALQLTTVCGFVGPPGVSRLTPLPHARVGCAAECLLGSLQGAQTSLRRWPGPPALGHRPGYIPSLPRAGRVLRDRESKQLSAVVIGTCCVPQEARRGGMEMHGNERVLALSVEKVFCRSLDVS